MYQSSTTKIESIGNTDTHTHTHTHTQVCIYEEVGRRKREKETDLLQEIVEAG